MFAFTAHSHGQEKQPQPFPHTMSIILLYMSILATQQLPIFLFKKKHCTSENVWF